MEKIFLASPYMRGEGFEREFVKEVFDTNCIALLRHKANGFSKMGSTDNALALHSDTSAILLALAATGV
ncbi:hypothetical protein PML80_06760 [Aerococcus urinaeequi]|uniref:Uncharacterized protein n=1 Tax=Aerococcus urinaeequi TaxID=51665 RepID=A0AAE9XR88_9LACT|nr:hypothetical protein [Aerococcus urinaeequi]WCG37224.1 hypothetical protein PML80_06760 [Aerococcus urinaeequi]